MEIEVEFPESTEGSVGIGNNVVTINKENLEIENQKIPLEKGKGHKLHIYVDKSVMEVFIDGHETFTAMLVPVTGNVEVSKSGKEIKVNVYELDAKDLYSRF